VSKPAFSLGTDVPKGHPHRLGSYNETLKWSQDKPQDRPSVRGVANTYVLLVDDVHQWFVQRDITYKLGHNHKVGFFIRVPRKHIILAKLTWG
jgi:hypothetical protein